MADLKISDLDLLTLPLENDDEIPLVDKSVGTTGQTKRTLINTFLGLKAGVGALSDHTYHGVTLYGRKMGYTGAIGDPVYLSSTTHEWMMADANLATPAYPARGVLCNAGSDGDDAVVLVFGVMRDDSWTFTEGATLYLTESGTIDDAAPSGSGSCVQIVGFALGASEAFFNFSGVYLELV
jgi:hypothetical protein